VEPQCFFCVGACVVEYGVCAFVQYVEFVERAGGLVCDEFVDRGCFDGAEGAVEVGVVGALVLQEEGRAADESAWAGCVCTRAPRVVEISESASSMRMASRSVPRETP
jgi:hypothetical protein